MNTIFFVLSLISTNDANQDLNSAIKAQNELQIQQQIMLKKLYKGMTKDELIASWGKPIDAGVSSIGQKEYFMYDNPGCKRSSRACLIYFKDGKISDLKEIKYAYLSVEG